MTLIGNKLTRNTNTSSQNTFKNVILFLKPHSMVTMTKSDKPWQTLNDKGIENPRTQKCKKVKTLFELQIPTVSGDSNEKKTIRIFQFVLYSWSDKETKLD